MGHRARSVAAALLLVVVAPGAVWAQPGRWQVGSFPSVSSGSYGTESRTTVVYTPMTARYLFEDGDVAVVVPFMCLSGNGAVTLIGDQPVRTGGDVGAGSLRGDPQNAPPVGRTTDTQPPSSSRETNGSVTVTSAPAATVTRCGYGDVVLRGRYYAIDQHGWWPTIAVRAHVKTPTASVERGLGTGRPDEGIGLEVTRQVTRSLSVLVDGGYTLIGQPDGITFNNRWWYDVGVSRSLAANRVSLTVFFEEYGAIVPGLPSARDVLAVLNVSGSSGWRLQVGGLVGLSAGAPDHALTFGVSRRF